MYFLCYSKRNIPVSYFCNGCLSCKCIWKPITVYRPNTSPPWNYCLFWQSLSPLFFLFHQGERFKAHGELTNRKLLWHGTNVAVVVAILKSGLRIMPHSGGRVGRGIYFASENQKSSCYGMSFPYHHTCCRIIPSSSPVFPRRLRFLATALVYHPLYLFDDREVSPIDDPYVGECLL